MAPERLRTLGEIAKACKESRVDMKARLAVAGQSQALPTIHDIYLHGFDDDRFAFGLTRMHIEFLIRRRYDHRANQGVIGQAVESLSARMKQYYDSHEQESAMNAAGMAMLGCQFPDEPIQVIDPSTLRYVRCYAVLEERPKGSLLIVVPGRVPAQPFKIRPASQPPRSSRDPQLL